MRPPESPLADVVVGFAVSSSVMPRGRKAPKLWPAMPVSLTADGVVRQASMAVAAPLHGDSMRAAVRFGSLNRLVDGHLLALLERRRALAISWVVERLGDTVVLRPRRWTQRLGWPGGM